MILLLGRPSHIENHDPARFSGLQWQRAGELVFVTVTNRVAEIDPGLGAEDIEQPVLQPLSSLDPGLEAIKQHGNMFVFSAGKSQQTAIISTVNRMNPRTETL